MPTTSQHTGPAGKPDDAVQECRVDNALEDTFPASDALSFTPDTGTGSATAAGEADSRGMPTSDRHESERAAGRQDAAQPSEHKDE